MKILYIILSLIVVVGCSRDDSSSRPRVSQIDFADLRERIEILNKSDAEVVANTWPILRAELTGYIRSGDMAVLSQDDQRALWWLLEYLRGCHHPDTLKNFGDEILEVLYALDTPKLNQDLRAILNPQ